MATQQVKGKKVIGVDSADTEFSRFVGGTLEAFLERFEIAILETIPGQGMEYKTLCQVGDKTVPIWKRNYVKVIVRHYVGRYRSSGEPVPPMTVGDDTTVIYSIRKF